MACAWSRADDIGRSGPGLPANCTARYCSVAGFVRVPTDAGHRGERFSTVVFRRDSHRINIGKCTALPYGKRRQISSTCAFAAKRGAE